MPEETETKEEVQISPLERAVEVVSSLLGGAVELKRGGIYLLRMRSELGVEPYERLRNVCEMALAVYGIHFIILDESLELLAGPDLESAVTKIVNKLIAQRAIADAGYLDI